MIAIIAAYAAMKGKIMMNYEDIIIQEPLRSNAHGPEYTYDARDGWRVAFGVTAYDSSSDPTPFDDSYGTMGAY